MRQNEHRSSSSAKIFVAGAAGYFAMSFSRVYGATIPANAKRDASIGRRGESLPYRHGRRMKLVSSRWSNC